MNLDTLRKSLHEAEQEFDRWEDICNGLRGVIATIDRPIDGQREAGPVIARATAPNGKAAVRNGTVIGDVMEMLKRNDGEMDVRDLQMAVDAKRGAATKISGVLSTETNKPKAERRVERTGPGMYRLAR